MANSSDRPESHDASNPAPTSMGIPRPPSVGGISSRVTDMASDDGDHSQSQTTTSQQPQSRPSASRRGPPPPARSSMTSRPASSASRLSRTHIPSLAAQGFFRPMSSQRLQAHRGRPMTKGTAASNEDWGEQTSQNRRSLISNGTFGQGSSAPAEQEVPPSRGTEFTDPIIPDRETTNASPTAQTTARSLGESARLLHDNRAQKATPQHLNLGVNYNNSNAQDPSQRSPLSFLSRNGGHEQRDSRGHERLSSAGSSPEPLDMKEKRASNKNLGKNYEYFLGNTIFWGGGRFQNSRDKPINIATGILVVVPSALFFGFSYVFLYILLIDN